MRILGFHNKAFDEYLTWYKENKLIFNKINTLLKEILRTPFYGIGKPEALKYNNENYWSRRITDEHRLIYQVQDDRILSFLAKGII